MFLEEVEKAKRIGKGGCGGDDFEQVRIMAREAGVNGFKIGRAMEVVPAEEERTGAVAEKVEVLLGGRVEFFCSL